MSRILYSLRSVQKILRESKFSKIYIVTSKKLLQKLSWAIKEINVPKSQIIVLPDGEKVKEWKEIEKLLKNFSKLNLDRKSIVIALGGGTVGDITGFATSIYLRGIRYIQIPTTLLAQVDSAHGGKTGINFSNYKNQIGSFHLPIAIVIDARFLKSLTREQIINGLGEIIKAGLIKDPSILFLLKKHPIGTLVKSSDLQKIIKKSIAVKNYFTGKDFKDNKSRQILNVGHTFGHAIELKYKISHGKAVLVGMLQELIFTETLGITLPSVRKNLLDLLGHLGIKIGTDMKADWKTVRHDKNITGSTIVFPVVEREGKVRILNLKTVMLKWFDKTHHK